MTKVVVVNGPNLVRLGVRQPDVYGKQDLETLRKLCTEWGHELGLDVEVRQSDDEAEMIHWMHQAADEKTPIVMNPAAFTHYSYGDIANVCKPGAWRSDEEVDDYGRNRKKNHTCHYGGRMRRGIGRCLSRHASRADT